MKNSILLFTLISTFCLISNLSYTQTPNWQWAKSAGGTLVDYGNSVVVDALGNTFITGDFDSPIITFGSYTQPNAGDGDIFIAKYDAIGNVLWAKSFGGTGCDNAPSISLDASGNAYVTGFFDSPTITFGSYTLPNAGSDDIFLVKFDASGNVLWAKSAGGIATDNTASVAVDASGNAYITGHFISPTITFDSYSLTNLGNDDVFLVKYDASGNVLWAQSAGGIIKDNAASVAIDASGNAYIAGHFNSPTITFGSYSLTRTGNFDIFLAKYNANGTVLWAKSAGGVSADITNSVAVDTSGNTCFTGVFLSATITFGSYTLTNSGEVDFFLAKYDADGNVLWVKSLGGADNDYGTSVTMDASGKIYLTGFFNSPAITFGSFTLMNSGGSDIYLSTYDASGNVLCAKSTGGTSNDMASSVAVDGSGIAHVTGSFNSSTITFGSNTLTNAGCGDIFLAKDDITTGITALTNSTNISIFPNPATQIITIATPEVLYRSELSILNTCGKTLITTECIESKKQFDISSLPSGVYFVRITCNKTVQIGKFIKL